MPGHHVAQEQSTPPEYARPASLKLWNRRSTRKALRHAPMMDINRCPSMRGSSVAPGLVVLRVADAPEYHVASRALLQLSATDLATQALNDRILCVLDIRDDRTLRWRRGLKCSQLTVE